MSKNGFILTEHMVRMETWRLLAKHDPDYINVSIKQIARDASTLENLSLNLDDFSKDILEPIVKEAMSC